jgi:surface polysaccharide O-acyltransferase-like enzyme
MRQERLYELDLLRIFAALAVIVIHTSSNFFYFNQLGYYLNIFCRFAVPTFLLISGIVLQYSQNSGNEFITKVFLKKRLTKVVIPYFVWTIIYIFYLNRHNIHDLLSLGIFKIIGESFIFGTGASHLYFILIIIQMYFLYPILRILMQKFLNMTLLISFVITLLIQTAIYLKLMHIINFKEYIINYSKLFPTWIFFFVFGIYLAKNLEKWKNLILKNSPVVVLLWGLSFVVLIADIKYTRVNSSMQPSVLIYSITSLAFFYIIFSKINKGLDRVRAFIDWASAQSMVIYFSQSLIIYLLLSVPRTIKTVGNIWGGTRGLLLLTVFSILFTFLFVYLSSLLPFGSYLGIVKSKRSLSSKILQKPGATI